jgi:hypothetical protein
MREPAPVIVTLRPSRRACCAIAAVAIATFAVVATLPVHAFIVAVTSCALACWAVDRIHVVGLRRGPRAVRALRIDGRRGIALRYADGRSVVARLLPSSRIGAGITTLVWRRHGAPWPRTLLILPDMLDPEHFRQLRVLVLHGRSGDAGGRPASHA